MLHFKYRKNMIAHIWPYFSGHAR